MGALRLALGTGVLAVAALTPAAHTAYAADGAGVSVVPAAPAPGTDVTVEVRGCEGRTASAASPAFVSDARLTPADGVLAGETRVRSSLTAGRYDVRVGCDEDERAGTVTVVPARVGQPGGTVTPSAPPPATPTAAPEASAHPTAAPEASAHPTAAPEASAHPTAAPEASAHPSAAPEVPAHPSAAASPSAPVHPAVPASPVAPVDAGGGATARVAAADTRAHGPGTAQAVTGLVLAGAAAAAVARVRARRGRGTG